jgi:hypothetical protein
MDKNLNVRNFIFSGSSPSIQHAMRQEQTKVRPDLSSSTYLMSLATQLERFLLSLPGVFLLAWVVLQQVV